MEKIVISCLDSRVETNRRIYARFLLGPFKDDNAITIATALRRSLLSKVKSIAITAIHIQGVTHEFSTIVGVRESVLDLALNFQQVVLRTRVSKQSKRTLKSKDPSFEKRYKQQDLEETVSNSGSLKDHNKAHPQTVQIGYLQIQGPAVVYANDLKLPVGVECVDPTQYLATLSVEGLLVVKFTVGTKKASLDISSGAFPGKERSVEGKRLYTFSKDLGNKSSTVSSPVQTFQDKSTYQNKGMLTKLRMDGKIQQPIVVSQEVSSDRASLSSFAMQGKSDLIESPGFFQLNKAVQGESIDLLYDSFLKANKQSNPFRLFDPTICLRDTIFLDPIFSSVLQANYIIERDDIFNQARERIVLEFWTNGSIHPREALHKASLSLVSTFSIFRKVFHLDSL